tara:strand:- start:1644 stop:2279 length:636 start_codon:yes stop_codon:yes gene_type:complete
MKNKLLIALIAISFSPLAVISQIDITPTYGYNFGAKNSGYYSEIKMKGNSTYGINLEYKLDDYTGIQFLYTYTKSTITIRDYSGPGFSQNFSNVTENYYLIGATRYFGEGKIEPYGAFNAGAAYYSFTDIDKTYSTVNVDALRFAIGFGLGAKLMFSEKIGLDVHIRALAPVTWGGIGVGVGTGGVSTGAYVGSSFISGDVGGGIVIRLGE